MPWLVLLVGWALLTALLWWWLFNATDKGRRLEEQREQAPTEFDPLARYNSEVARGLVHTPEWQAEMAVLQQRFNEWVEKLPAVVEARR